MIDWLALGRLRDEEIDRIREHGYKEHYTHFHVGDGEWMVQREGQGFGGFFSEESALAFIELLRGIWGGITAEERACLTRYAAQEGRYWKSKLRDCWFNANYPGVDDNDASCLQRLRNSQWFGPEGLIKFRL